MKVNEMAGNLDDARDRLRAQAEAAGPGYLTVDEAAALARMHPKTIRRAYESGELPASRPKHRVLIREDDLRNWIEATPARASEPHPWAKPPPPKPSAPGAPKRRSKAKPATESVTALRAIERNLTR